MAVDRDFCSSWDGSVKQVKTVPVQRQRERKRKEMRVDKRTKKIKVKSQGSSHSEVRWKALDPAFWLTCSVTRWLLVCTIHSASVTTLNATSSTFSC